MSTYFEINGYIKIPHHIYPKIIPKLQVRHWLDEEAEGEIEIIGEAELISLNFCGYYRNYGRHIENDLICLSTHKNIGAYLYATSTDGMSYAETFWLENGIVYSQISGSKNKQILHPNEPTKEAPLQNFDPKKWLNRHSIR